MTDELTPEEKEALKGLPRERMPSAGLEDRVVGALKERDILSRRRRRTIEITNSRVIGVLAAGIALIVGAYSIGLHRGGEPALPGTELLRDRVTPMEREVDAPARVGEAPPEKNDEYVVFPRKVQPDLANLPVPKSSEVTPSVPNTPETTKDVGDGSGVVAGEVSAALELSAKEERIVTDEGSADREASAEKEKLTAKEEIEADADHFVKLESKAAPAEKTIAPLPEPSVKPSAPAPVEPEGISLPEYVSGLDAATSSAQTMSSNASGRLKGSRSESAPLNRSTSPKPRVRTLPGIAVAPDDLSARPFRFLLNGQSIYVENPDDVRIEQENSGEWVLVIHMPDVIYRMRLER